MAHKFFLCSWECFVGEASSWGACHSKQGAADELLKLSKGHLHAPVPPVPVGRALGGRIIIAVEVFPFALHKHSHRSVAWRPPPLLERPIALRSPASRRGCPSRSAL